MPWDPGMGMIPTFVVTGGAVLPHTGDKMATDIGYCHLVVVISIISVITHASKSRQFWKWPNLMNECIAILKLYEE